MLVEMQNRLNLLLKSYYGALEVVDQQSIKAIYERFRIKEALKQQLNQQDIKYNLS